MLQTAASLVVEELPPQADALRGQPDYPSSDGGGGGMKRRPANRKRKRRPQVVSEDAGTGPTAVSPIPHWRGHNDDNNNNEYNVSPSPTPESHSGLRSTAQTGARRRKPSTVREPLAALEKEQKLYELRNTKPEAGPTTGSQNRNSENLKNILKNNGGLSLSEILQQKNLSLDDLLKGKHNALQALQTTATAPVQNPGREPPSRFATKTKYKGNSSAAKTTPDNRSDNDSKEHSKLTALQKLKLFGTASRPSGIQVGLADHLTTRKKEGPLYTTTTTTSTSTTTTPSTTRIPLYKKILHQRSTLRPSFLLKNSQVVASMEPEHVTSWANEEMEHEDEMENEEARDNEQEEMEMEEGEQEDNLQSTMESTTTGTEATTWRPEPTVTTTTTSKPTTKTTRTTRSTTTTTTTTERPTTKELTTSTRRMYSSTRGLGRTTNRFTTTSSTTTPPPPITTTPSSTTTSQQPQTTTTTTSTTTASSSTMNLTPRANLNLNTDDIRERIQETLLKNLIEKEDALKKTSSSSSSSSSAEMDVDDDLENFFEETVKPKTTKSLETSTITTRMKQYTSAAPPPQPTPSLNFIPDFDNVDDRTDLLELIEDRRSGNRLFKVLEQRNMTLDELIEHRKRGSSQLHLATIVQSPSRFYPDKKVVLQDNMDIVTAFENFPHFNLMNLKSVKPDDIKTDSQGSSYFTSIIDIEPTDEVYKSGKGTAMDDKVSFLPDRSDKSLGFFPSWKTLALASLATSTTKKDTGNNGKKISPFYLAQPKMLLENNSNEDDYEIRENELVLINSDDNEEGGDGDADEDANADVDYRPQSPVQAAVRVAASTNLDVVDNLENRAHDLVDLELSGHGFKRSPVAAGALASHKYGNFYANMPAGIKSAIVASATIVLTALVTFMVIFAVFRWKQKRHRMTNIMKSYNAMKSKLPPIATTTTASAAVTAANASCTRHSSLREMNSLLGGSGLSVAATITTTTTGVPNTPSPAASQTTLSLATATATSLGQHQHQQQHQHPLRNSSSSSKHQQQQRPSSLLFQRVPTSNENPTNLSILSNCNLADLKRTSDLRGSTTSLSFSLTSGHNIPSTHMCNSMDANSPEVQEYLFDTLRNSF